MGGSSEENPRLRRDISAPDGHYPEPMRSSAAWLAWLGLLVAPLSCQACQAPQPRSTRAPAASASARPVATASASSVPAPLPATTGAPPPTVVTLLYPPRGCVAAAPPNPKRAPWANAPLACDEATRARDAWLAEVRRTSALPRAVPAGARRSSLDRKVDRGRLRLTAWGALGSTIVTIDPASGAVKGVMAGDFVSGGAYGPDHLALQVSTPGSPAATVLDLVDREHRVAVRLTRSAGTAGPNELLLRGGEEPAERAAATARFVASDLPAAASTTEPPDGVAVWDFEAKTARRWPISDADARLLDRSVTDVVWLGKAGVAIGMVHERRCHGSWLDPRATAPRPICSALQTDAGGVIVRAGKRGAEVVAIDRDGRERLLDETPLAPGALELVPSTTGQVAWASGEILHAAAGAVGESRGVTEIRAKLPCRSAPVSEGGCMFAGARRLTSGALLAHIVGGGGERVVISGRGGWTDTPVPEGCAIDDVTLEPTTALVRCADRAFVRTFGDDGATSDAPAPEGRIARVALERTPPSELRIAGVPVCATEDGLLWASPSCPELPVTNRKR